MQPTPQFSLIAGAAVAQLRVAGVAGGQVERVFVPPSAASAVSGSVAVRIDRALPNPAALRGNPVDWNTSLRLDLEARFGVGNQEPDAIVCELAAQAWAALFADESLGGIADGMLPGTVTWDFSDPERQTARCSIFLTVLHRTHYGAL